ncbi:UNVERIFIED_CONTAM: hypothetical protein Sradi_2485400 [Sesamum radiatum]|uniref:Uncharacterized protein n=1 Tax=Sesamum radiatum TaxID=300843 RepID=A0AAW2SLM0_SESRA
MRFRAICSAWQSFTEEFSCTWKNPCFPSFGEGSWQRGLCCTLTERIVYCIESPERTEPSFWLVKMERTNYGKLRLLNPVSKHKMSETQLPKLFDVLDFCVSKAVMNVMLIML